MDVAIETNDILIAIEVEMAKTLRHAVDWRCRCGGVDG